MRLSIWLLSLWLALSPAWADSSFVAPPTYVTGTCTPTFAGASTAGTGQSYAASGQICNYEQVGGRQVTVRIWISATSLGTASGNLLVQGLPITANAGTGFFGSCVAGFYSGITGLPASNFGIVGLIRPSTTQIEISSNGSTGSTQITAAQAGASASLSLVCSYQS